MKIKKYKSNLQIFKNGEVNTIDFDGQAGLFTEEEWCDSELSEYNDTEQSEILHVLCNTSNIPFFNS